MGTDSKRLAVVGGGINGAGVAWELSRRGYDVVLYEKARCGEQTSWKTTKMIHGGLRYLENFHIGVVRESLHDRAWLLETIPELVQPIEIILPIYGDSPRSRLTIKTGLLLYDFLAGKKNIRKHRWWTREEITKAAPLVDEGLRGGYSYWDAQVDDRELVRSVVAAAKREGATIRELTRVNGLRPDGKQWIVKSSAGDENRFDLVINAAGPWMNELLAENRIRARYTLSLVRGSHLVLTRRISDKGVLLQSNDDRRVFFVLPWKETTLVGTTEVVHRRSLEDVQPSEQEIEYLLVRYNRYFRQEITRRDIASMFAGVRPLVGRATNPGAISRDYRIVRRGNLINIFGGKMTTFMSMARKVAMRVDNYFGKPRPARPPRFKNRTMSFVPTLDADAPQRRRISRTLDSTEIRVLGSLMEKQLATPEYYPLTLNALVAACNQKSNREPVMELDENDVQRALERLQDEKLVWKVMGGRAVRYDHNLDSVWHLKRPEKALVTLLFLRGPQTSGELRGRSDRLHQFQSIAEVEDILRDMAAHSEPLVRQLPRRPGQKEERWAQTVGGEVVADEPPAPLASSSGEPLSARVARLEERMAAIEEALSALKSQLGS